MRIKHRKLTMGLLTVGIFAASAALAEDVWVKSDNVSVLAGKGAIYPVVASVPKGMQLNVLGHEGKWMKVQVKDKDGNPVEGYVFENAVSADKVDGGGNALANMGAGANATDMSTVSAAKGLQDDAEQYAKGKHLSPEALNKLIEFRKRLDPKLWEKFTAEGKVGPDAP